MTQIKPRAQERGFPPSACGSCSLRMRAVYRKICEQHPLAIETIRSGQLYYKKGSLIRLDEETNRKVYTLYAGWALRSRATRDGRRQILSFLMAGDLIGLEHLGEDSAGATVRAVTDVALCEFNAGDMLSMLVRTKESAIELSNAHGQRHRENDQTILALGRCSATERMISLIMTLRMRLAAQGVNTEKMFSLPLRRKDFADALGLTEVHVSRTLAKLKHEGILEFRQGVVTILNNARLLAIAETVKLNRAL